MWPRLITIVVGAVALALHRRTQKLKREYWERWARGWENNELRHGGRRIQERQESLSTEG